MRTTDIKNYVEWKLKKTSKVYENVYFWITIGQIGSILTLLQTRIDLLFLNIIIVFLGYFLMDFKRGRWKGDLREEDRKRAVELYKQGIKTGDENNGTT